MKKCSLFKTFWNCFYLYIAMSMISCTSTNHSPQIEEILKLAGNNRDELETVLKHYSQNPEDSLKLKAAVFLILNMPGKYTETYPTGWEEISAALYRSDHVTNFSSIEKSYHLGRKIIQDDLHHIQAEYLIQNIDLAFSVWKEQPWGKHITFDIFCEEILPYRIGREPLENWREKVLTSFADINNYFKTHPNTTVIEACKIVNRELPRFSWVSYEVPPMNYSMLISTPRGTCDEMGNLAIFTLRALGIPVTRDFTLQWPNRNLGHSWNAVCDSTGKHISFMGTEKNPGEEHLGTRLAKSKVYRMTFAKQQINISDNPSLIPPELQNPYIKDVSEEYEDCKYQAEVPSLSATTTKRPVYLLSFGKEASCIVDRGEQVKKRFKFSHIGKNVLYLPVYYTRKGTIPAGYPFRITSDGKIKYFNSNSNKKEKEVI